MGGGLPPNDTDPPCLKDHVECIQSEDMMAHSNFRLLKHLSASYGVCRRLVGLAGLGVPLLLARLSHYPNH